MHSNKTSGQTCPLIKKRWVGKGDYLTPIFWKLSKRERFLFGPRTERERERQKAKRYSSVQPWKNMPKLYTKIYLSFSHSSAPY